MSNTNSKNKQNLSSVFTIIVIFTANGQQHSKHVCFQVILNIELLVGNYLSSGSFNGGRGGRTFFLRIDLGSLSNQEILVGSIYLYY